MSNANKTLYDEGSILLRYVSSKKPNDYLVNQYVLCVELISDGRPLNLPKIVKLFPALLFLFENNK